MHELSIALSIVDIAGEEAERHGGATVLSVHVKLGALSGVMKEALSSAYELAREGSSVPESRLVIEDVPLVIRCPQCDRESTVPTVYDLRCSYCGTPSAEIVSGRELEVTAMEIQE